MRVKVRMHISAWPYLVDAFIAAKEADHYSEPVGRLARLEIIYNDGIEVEWEPPMPVEREKIKKMIYTTCRGNYWIIERNQNHTYLEYIGTRAGFARLQPFPGLGWDAHSRELIISLESKEIAVDVVMPDGEISKVYFVVPEKTIRYKVEVAEYDTSTPKEWALEPWDQVDKYVDASELGLLIEPLAIIKYADGRMDRIIKYKNVYESETG